MEGYPSSIIYVQMFHYYNYHVLVFNFVLYMIIGYHMS